MSSFGSRLGNGEEGRGASGGTLAARENPGLAQSWRGQAQLQCRCTGFTEPLEYLWGSNAACSASDLHIQQYVPELEHAGASSHLKVLADQASILLPHHENEIFAIKILSLGRGRGGGAKVWKEVSCGGAWERRCGHSSNHNHASCLFCALTVY